MLQGWDVAPCAGMGALLGSAVRLNSVSCVYIFHITEDVTGHPRHLLGLSDGTERSFWSSSQVRLMSNGSMGGSLGSCVH